MVVTILETICLHVLFYVETDNWEPNAEKQPASARIISLQ